MKSKLGLTTAIVFALFTLIASNAAAQAATQTATQAGTQTAPAASDSASSLGDYARKVHKDSGTTKPKPKVFDNDNLPKDDKLSVVGQPVATSAPDAPTPEANAKANAPADAKAAPAAKPADDEEAKKQAVWKGWHDKLTAQKGQIDLASRELDVTQREYQLRAAVVYADAGNRLRNSTQWDKQEADYKQQIADKQKLIDDAKQKMTDMQEDARKAGVPASMIE